MISFDRHLRRIRYGLQIILEFGKIGEVIKAIQKKYKKRVDSNISRKPEATIDKEINKKYGRRNC